jgi:hypothetical protein
MILSYLKWLQNVLQCSHRNDCWCRFHFHLPLPQSNSEGCCTGCLAVVPLLALFHLLLTDLSLHSRTSIESVSMVQSAILTKRSNSLLAVHVLLTQQHSFRFYLHLPQIEEVTDAYFCRRMCQSKIE